MLMMVSGGHSPAIDCHYLLLTANGCQLDGSGTLSSSGVLETFPSLPFFMRTRMSSSQALSSTPKALRELKREYDMQRAQRHLRALGASAPKVFFRYYFVNSATGEKSGIMLASVT